MDNNIFFIQANKNSYRQQIDKMLEKGEPFFLYVCNNDSFPYMQKDYFKRNLDLLTEKELKKYDILFLNIEKEDVSMAEIASDNFSLPFLCYFNERKISKALPFLFKI